MNEHNQRVLWRLIVIRNYVRAEVNLGLQRVALRIEIAYLYLRLL